MLLFFFCRPGVSFLDMKKEAPLGPSSGSSPVFPQKASVMLGLTYSSYIFEKDLVELLFKSYG